MAAYQASINTRYRTYYMQLLEQFLTINLHSSTIGSNTIFSPYSGQGFTIEGMTRAEQWQQPSSSSSVFDSMGQEWTMLQPDKQAQVPVPSTPPVKAEQVTPSRTGKRKSVDQMAGNARQQAQHNTHNGQVAREILHAQAQAMCNVQILMEVT